LRPDYGQDDESLSAISLSKRAIKHISRMNLFALLQVCH
jgi:hypothetical protein